MRKLFLLICLAFAVYYGASLWNFTSVESLQVAANYYPIALLLGIFIIGLVHLRFGLGLSIILILLFGHPVLLDKLLVLVPGVPDAYHFFTLFQNPVESIILGIFSAWIIVRFIGNPELDYEISRAEAVRALHFPVFIFAFTAILSALYAIIATHNVFFSTFWAGIKNSFVDSPFAFLSGATVLAPIRNVIYLLEGIALYTIAVNEIRTARQARVFLWILLSAAVIVVLVGVGQVYIGGAYSTGMWKYNLEMHSTFIDPNTLAVFLLAMLPLSIALILRGRIASVFGVITGIILIGAIVLTGTKLAIFLTGLVLVLAFLILLVRVIKLKAIVPLVLMILLVVVIIGSYFWISMKAKSEAEAKEGSKLATKTVEKINGTVSAFFKGEWTAKDLNTRSNSKFGDWVTAIRMVNPMESKSRENFLRGVGYEKFKAHYRTFQPEWIRNVNRDGASNMFLHVMAEFGIFGAIALLLITLFAIFYCFGAAKQLEYPLYVKATSWGLLMLVIGCMGENSFLKPQLQAVFWLLVGICMVFASLSSASENKGIRGAIGLNSLLLLLIIGTWAWLVIPVLMEQRATKITTTHLAERYANMYKDIKEDELLTALETTGDYNFNRNGPLRWSEKNSFVKTQITGPILSTTLRCLHPDVSPSNTVTATLFIDKKQIAQVVFEQPGIEPVNVDLTQNAKMIPYVESTSNVLLHVNVNRVWAVHDFYPKFPENYDVGVAVSGISYSDEMPPPPPPKPEPPTPPAPPAVDEESAAPTDAPPAADVDTDTAETPASTAATPEQNAETNTASATQQ